MAVFGCEEGLGAVLPPMSEKNTASKRKEDFGGRSPLVGKKLINL